MTSIDLEKPRPDAKLIATRVGPIVLEGGRSTGMPELRWSVLEEMLPDLKFVLNNLEILEEEFFSTSDELVEVKKDIKGNCNGGANPRLLDLAMGGKATGKRDGDRRVFGKEQLLQMKQRFQSILQDLSRGQELLSQIIETVEDKRGDEELELDEKEGLSQLLDYLISVNEEYAYFKQLTQEENNLIEELKKKATQSKSLYFRISS